MSVRQDEKNPAAPSPRPNVSMDRVMQNVVAPPMWALSSEELFLKEKDANGQPKINIALLKEHLLKEGRLTTEAATMLIDRASAIIRTEPNMLELRYPVTVCGDLHGQFFDLAKLLDVGGDPKDTQYLFLGDYVDRGCFSTEVVFYLYALKITYPKSFFMLRGNHECRQLTSFFNFKDECVYKYDLAMYDMIMNSFDVLPLAALVNKTFFCVHGGLSPDITTLDEVRSLDRFQEIPREGPMCDLLWSDPYEEDAVMTADNPDNDGHGAVAQPGNPWFGYNSTRQCSYVYGIEAVKQFLKDNKLTSVIRAHEAQLEGYKMQMVNKSSGIPRVITIFSAPNYCDVYKNKAACLKFDNNILNIKQFVDTAHPYYLPNFMDVFQWSLPFVAEKVTDLLANVLDCDLGSDDDSDDEGKGVAGKGGLLKKKVLAVSKLLRMYKILRQENETILQLKQLTPNHKVPLGLLHEGPQAIQQVLTNFDTAKQADMVNEKRPDPSLAIASSPTSMMRRMAVEHKLDNVSSSSSSSSSAPASPMSVSPSSSRPSSGMASSISSRSPSSSSSSASSPGASRTSSAKHRGMSSSPASRTRHKSPSAR